MQMFPLHLSPECVKEPFVYKIPCGLYLSGFVTYKSFNMGQWLEGWGVGCTVEPV